MKTNYNNIREREEAAQTLLAAYRQGDQNAFILKSATYRV